MNASPLHTKPQTEPTVTTALMAASSTASNAPTLYFKRWFILLLFSLLSMMNACDWITFSPFASKAAKFYNQNSLAIDMFSLCYMIVYIPCIFLSSHLISRYGLRFGMIISACLNTVGAWMRYAGSAPDTPIYAVVLVGQILCSAAQTFILQVPPLIANDWFGQKERTFATSIGADFNQLGVAIGFLMGAFMVKQESDIRMLLLSQAIMTTIPSVLAIVFIRDKPPTPPSFAASQKVNTAAEHQSGFIENTKRLVTNKSYMILWIDFGLIIGSFYAVSTVLPLLLENYNYSSSDGGFLGFILTVVGIVGAIVVGVICDRTHRYKEILIFVNVGNTACFVWLALIVKPDIYAHLAVNQSILGLFITGAIPSYLETAAELTYPHVPEDFAAGILIMGAQVFGIILTFIMSWMIQSQLHIGALWLTVGVCAATVLLVFIVTPKYRRLDAETARAQSLASEESNVQVAVAKEHLYTIHHEIVGLDDHIFHADATAAPVPQPVSAAKSNHKKHSHHHHSKHDKGKKKTSPDIDDSVSHESDSTLQHLEDEHHHHHHRDHSHSHHHQHHHHSSNHQKGGHNSHQKHHRHSSRSHHGSPDDAHHSEGSPNG